MWNDLQRLNLDESATWQDVKDSYQNQLRTWHPDRFVTDAGMRARCEERTKEVNRSFNEIKRKISQIDNFKTNQSVLVQYNSLTEEKIITQAEYKQEPFLGTNKAVTSSEVSTNEDSIRNKYSKSEREQGVSPYLFLVLGFLILTLLSTLFYIYTIFVNPKRKIVYGPPADLSKIYGNTSVKNNAGVIESTGTDAIADSIARLNPNIDGVISGQQSSLRMISGIGQSLPGAEPAITLAASRCDMQGVKKQLSKGVKVNIEDSKGLSPLSWAARTGCEDLTRYLLKRGANVNHMSLNGFTPLAWAKWYKNIKVIKVLELTKK